MPFGFQGGRVLCQRDGGPRDYQTGRAELQRLWRSPARPSPEGEGGGGGGVIMNSIRPSGFIWSR